MIRLAKLAAALAVLPVLAAAPVLADSPGQLTGGSNTYQVKNLTQNGSYANTISVACGDQLQHSVRLHNAAFGGLTNIQVSANLISGKMTAVPAEGASQGTTGSISVSLPSNGSLAYQSGSTVLYNSNSVVIKTLPDGITTNGVNVGNLPGSTTEFVIFKSKVACPPATHPVFACVGLSVSKIDRTHFDFTAQGSATDATIQSYGFTAKNSNGNAVDTQTVNTSATSAVYHFSQSTPGTYTVSAVVNTDHGSTSPNSACTQHATVEQPPVTPPPSPTPTPTPPPAKGPTEIPNTGPGSVIGLFAGVTTLAGIGHFIWNRRAGRLF